MSNPLGNKLGPKNNWNQTLNSYTFSPAKWCSLCGDEVSRNRAVVLDQPRLTMCPDCHEAHLDDLLSLSQEHDVVVGDYYTKEFR